MKRKITSLTTAIIVLFLILFTLPETVVGQEKTNQTATLTFKTSSAPNSPTTNNNVTFNWSGTGNTLTFDNSNSCGFKKSNAFVTITIPNGATLKKISKVNTQAWGGAASIKVYTGTDTNGTLVTTMNYNTNEYTISSNNTGTTYYIINNVSANAWVSSITIEYEPASGPSVTASPTTLSGFSYVVGNGPSTQEKYITVSGSNLGSNNLVVTPGANYQVRKADGEFTSDPISYTPSNGSVANSTVYVRLKAGLYAGTYNSGDANTLVVSSGTATPVNVTLSGTVVATHTVTYHANGGTGSDIVRNYDGGDNVTIEDNTFTAPDNNTFVKWNTLSTGLGVDYEPGDVIEGIAANYELYAIWAEKCTLTLNSNGMITTTDILQDVEYTFPVPNNVPAGYALRGWSTKSSDIEEGDVKKKFTPDAGTATYYAVFGEGGYTKVTSEPTGTDTWDGEYLIVFDKNATTAYVWTGVDANNCYTSKPISSSTIRMSDDLVSVTIASMTGGYSIKVNGGTNKNKYISGTSGSNTINFGNSEVLNTLSYSSGVSITSNTSVMVFNNNYDNNNTYRFRYYKSSSYGQYTKVQLYKLTLTGYYTSVSAPVASNITITTPTIITNGSVLNMGDHALTNDNPANLIIEDGAQLICDNSVAATFKKTMPTPAAPSTKDEPEDVYGWELISSPVHDDNGSTIEVTNVTNLTTSPYDMFAYDEKNSQWLNQKNNGGATGFNTLSNGQGYMYRNNAQELSFVGNTNVNDVEVSLTYTAGAGDLAGFHLVGNPYTENITLMNTTLYNGDIQLDNGEQLSAYYILKDNGSSWKTDLAANTPIANKQGFLIEIPSNATKIKFSRTARTAKSHGDNIKFMVANSQFEDVTYALFDKALPLNKINHRNPEVPMIYINQNDQDYAVATMTDDTKAFNLNFKAGTMSKYTLSYKADGSFDYIHVIDRMTGEDIDMLLEGEYSFIGTPKDSENRFIVHLEYMPNYGEDSNDIFAYQSGSDIYVSGQGELQVFDVTGRRVMTTTINGAESISIPAQGVYIFKLNEKVQKIVVR